MTTQEIIDYYADLLILQYLGKPNAYATIQTVVAPVIMDQLPVQVQDAFNLTGEDTAVGDQLDILGKYAGVSRVGYNFDGPTTLDDADFLMYIRLAIVQNNLYSSLYDIQNLLNTFFPGQIFVWDYQNMSICYAVNSSVGSQNLVQFFILQNVFPRPMGVQLSVIIYAPVLNTFFGLRTYEINTTNNSPLNSYEDYQTDRPFLNYSDGIIT